MNCPGCKSLEVTAELRTGSDGGPAGMGFRCMECGHSWVPTPFNGQNVAPQNKPEPISVPRLVQSEQPKPKPQRALTNRSIITEARRELKRLDVEIARLKKLQKQRDELSRLLDAATGAGKLVPIKCAANSR